MIALDTNLFIYVLEEHPEFGNRAALVLAEAQGNGMASELVYLELLSAPAFKRLEYKRQALNFLEGQQLEFVPLDKTVLLQAAALRAARTPVLGVGDALHIASALRAGADTFITNDKALAKLTIPGLKIETL